MRAGPHQIQTARLLADVVGPEPRRLQDAWLDRESAAVRRQVAVPEILGRQDHLLGQPRLEAGQRLLDLARDAGAVRVAHPAPVHRVGVAEMRHRRQDVEGVVALRRDRRVGDRGAVDVEAHVLGQLSAGEHVRQQALVARRVDDGVMAHVGPHPRRPARAEVPDEQPHRPAAAIQLGVRPPLAGPAAQQAGIGVAGICIAHHQGRRQDGAIRQPHARRGAVRQQDLVRLAPQPHRAALRLDHADHRVGDRLHAAHGVVHAELLLQMPHEGVDRRHVPGIATDEERVERQRHAQPRVLHPRLGQSQDRPVRPQPRKCRQHLQRVPQAMHRLGDHALEPDDIAGVGVTQELPVSGDIAGRQPRHLGQHRIGVLPRGESRPVRPAHLVEGIERAQVHLGVEVPPAGGPERAVDLRHRDDRRPQVEPVPALRHRGSAPARPVQPVDHRDPVSLGAQSHRRCQTPQPGADDDGCVGTGGGGIGGGGIGGRAGGHHLIHEASLDLST